MITPRAILGSLSGLMFLLCLQGCASSFEKRAQEKATTFGKLDAATQEHIHQGLIENGYTRDMVYIALGRPTETKASESPDGKVDIWIYRNMTVARKAGFKGVTYNSDFAITPGSRTGRSSIAPGKQTYNALDQNELDAATQLPDLPMGTLHVYFFQGRVYKMALKL